MEPPTPTPYVQGGRFLEAYRKLSARLEELDPAGSQHGRTPKQDGCETVPCWEPHSFAYVLGNANENVAFEIAAALAQFEPVTMAVEGRQAYVRARRSLPDNIRLVQLFDVPDSWADGNPISFTRALAGDLRVIEYNCADAPQGAKPTLFRQICEVERIHRYGGPTLCRGVSLGPEQPFVEVNGRGQVLLSPASDENLEGGRDEDLAAKTSSHRRPHEMTLFAKGQHSVICFANARFSQDGGVIVPRTTSKASADALRAQVGQVHELDERYMGFFVANGGVLVPAYGKKDIDLRAMKVLARLFPKRRVVQIQTSRPRLNINDFVLGFPGPKPRAAPGSKILRASAALTQMNKTQQDILQRRLLLDQRRTRIFSLRLPSSENADNVEDGEDGRSDTFGAMQSQRSLLASSRTPSPSRHQQRMMQQQHELKLSSSRSNALCAIDAASGSQSDVGETELARQMFSREGSASNLLSRSSIGSDCREEHSASGLQLGQMEAGHSVRTGSASRVTSSSEIAAPLEPPLEADTIGLVEDPQPQFTLTEPPTGGKSASRFTSTLGIFSKRKTSTRKSDKLQVPEDGSAKDNDPPTR